jgi:nucleoside-diphosphate-sugar epimerase
VRVFVAGGSGAVGRRLVPQLVARGHQVTATATGPSKLSLLEELGADGVVMDGLNAVSVGQAVAAARPDAEPAPASEWLPYLAACVGAKRPLPIPKWVARILAGDMAVIMMAEGRGFSNAKAKRELGWTLRYPSWRLGFKEELA